MFEQKNNNNIYFFGFKNFIKTSKPYTKRGWGQVDIRKKNFHKKGLDTKYKSLYNKFNSDQEEENEEQDKIIINFF